MPLSELRKCTACNSSDFVPVSDALGDNMTINFFYDVWGQLCNQRLLLRRENWVELKIVIHSAKTC